MFVILVAGDLVSNGGIKNNDVEMQPSSGFSSREIKAEESLEEEEEERGEIFGESCTNGSTSKSSSEWRNSVKTDDPFSSSSRRSCPKWESYTVFQKYDEEMTFLTRVSAQKLHETGENIIYIIGTHALNNYQLIFLFLCDRIVKVNHGGAKINIGADRSQVIIKRTQEKTTTTHKYYY